MTEIATLIRCGRELAKRLADYRRAEGKHFIELAQRAHQLEDRILARADILETQTPKVTFVAHKGVGKSTIINALAGLWLDVPPPLDATSKYLNQQALLPLGNGGTTPCEIEVQGGGPWQVRVEPASDRESRQLLQEFAEWAWHKAREEKTPGDNQLSVDGSESDADEPSKNGRTPRLQPDIERVIRGITSLGERQTQTASAAGVAVARPRRVTHDDAVDLARNHLDLESFVAEVVRRARLPERRRVQWLPTGEPRRWVRETLLNLVEGKFEDQPFPTRMIVYAPSTGVAWHDQEITLVDTLGLPAVSSKQSDEGAKSRQSHPLAERRDLRELLKAPWNLVVVGSQFNEPPAPSTDLLQQMMDEHIYFGETLSDRTVVAIVDNGKAGAGNFDDAETERAKKEDRCAENLARLGCPHADGGNWTVDDARERVFCVNVLDGGADGLRLFLSTALDRMLDAHRRRMVAETEAGQTFFLNLGDARQQAIRGEVMLAFRRHLAAVGRHAVGKVAAFRSNLLGPFSDECLQLHHSTLRSMVVHRGDGTQNAWALLESATIRELGRLLAPLRDDLTHTADALRAEERYRDESAKAVIDEERERRAILIETFHKLLVAELEDAAREALVADPDLWSTCSNEWGAGIKSPKYKARVAQHFRSWGIDHTPSLLVDLSGARDLASTDDSGVLPRFAEAHDG